MKFVRVVVDKVSDEVVCVIEQDVPFSEEQREDSGHIRDRACETIELGAVLESGEWTHPVSGQRVVASAHLYHRIVGEKIKPQDLREKRAKPELHVEGLHGLSAALHVQTIHDSPCSIEGIKVRLRAGGPEAIPVSVRAWLANILPPDTVAGMGLARGLPLSAMKAAEALRVKRDPSSGSRMFVIERAIQAKADAHAAARLKARNQNHGGEG